MLPQSPAKRREKLKVKLQLALSRMRVVRRRRTELSLRARSDIVELLLQQKPERARIRSEQIIRDDLFCEALELLESFSNLLLARLHFFEQSHKLAPEISEAVVSILWAEPRVGSDIEELKSISRKLERRYGESLANEARKDRAKQRVAPMLRHKLEARALTPILVEKTLVEIAASAHVPFTPDPDIMREDEVAAAEKMLLEYQRKLAAVEAATPPAEIAWRRSLATTSTEWKRSSAAGGQNMSNPYTPSPVLPSAPRRSEETQVRGSSIKELPPQEEKDESIYENSGIYVVSFRSPPTEELPSTPRPPVPRPRTSIGLRLSHLETPTGLVQPKGAFASPHLSIIPQEMPYENYAPSAPSEDYAAIDNETPVLDPSSRQLANAVDELQRRLAALKNS